METVENVSSTLLKFFKEKYLSKNFIYVTSVEILKLITLATK